jgi:hypothetical protein
MSAPYKENAFGTALHSKDVIKGLRQANPRIQVPEPTSWGCWYPGLDVDQTSVWLGPARQQGSKLICGITLGMIPEFTKIAPDGQIISKGWRAILWKCIRARVASKRRIERIFKVNLDIGEPDQGCRQCAKTGQHEKATSASGLCDLHDMIYKNAQRMKAAKQARKEISCP